MDLLVLDNLITPRRAGQGLNLSPAVVFLSFVSWTWVFGQLGALMAIPLTVLVKTLARSTGSTCWLATLASARMVEEDQRSDLVQPEARKETSGGSGESPTDRGRGA